MNPPPEAEPCGTGRHPIRQGRSARAEPSGGSGAAWDGGAAAVFHPTHLSRYLPLAYEASPLADKVVEFGTGPGVSVAGVEGSEIRGGRRRVFPDSAYAASGLLAPMPFVSLWPQGGHGLRAHAGRGES
jgi:hypothetical protein